MWIYICCIGTWPVRHGNWVQQGFDRCQRARSIRFGNKSETTPASEAAVTARRSLRQVAADLLDPATTAPPREFLYARVANLGPLCCSRSCQVFAWWLSPCRSQKACQEISCIAPVVDVVDRKIIIAAFVEDTRAHSSVGPRESCAVSSLLKH